jgi:hypothetical protein
MRYRLLRLVLAPVRFVGREALRVVLTGVILVACFGAVARYLGLPVPGVSELADVFAGLSRLARVLS